MSVRRLRHPAVPSGLILWLDAERLPLVYKDYVLTWPDQSGRGNDAHSDHEPWSQTIDLTGATGGSWEVADPVEVTYSGPIDWDATADEVYRAVAELPSMVGVGFTVTLEGQVYTITIPHPPTWAAEAFSFATGDDDLVDAGAVISMPDSVRSVPRLVDRAVQVDWVAQFFVEETRSRLALPLGLLNGLSAVTCFAVVELDPADDADVSVIAVSSGQEGDDEEPRFELIFEATGPTVYGGYEGDWSYAQYNQGNHPAGCGVPAVAWGMIDFASSSLVTGVGDSVVRDVLPTGGERSFTSVDAQAALMFTGMAGNGDHVQRIYEVAVWDRALNSRERRLVREYLSARWGTI